LEIAYGGLIIVALLVSRYRPGTELTFMVKLDAPMGKREENMKKMLEQLQAMKRNMETDDSVKMNYMGKSQARSNVKYDFFPGN
jgi:hypothetical protein